MANPDGTGSRPSGLDSYLGDSTLSSVFPDSRQFAAENDTQINALLTPAPRIGWRRRVLLLAAVLGCLTVFLLARVMANNPAVNARWQINQAGQVELLASEDTQLREHLGSAVVAAGSPNGQPVPYSALVMLQSARWLTSDALRTQVVEARVRIADAMRNGAVRLWFDDGSTTTVATGPRGYSSLGTLFWLLSAAGMVLYLVGWIVPLVQPQMRNVLYGVAALAQATQLLLEAVGSVQSLAPTPVLAINEGTLRTLLDVVTGAALVHATALSPVRLSMHRTIGPLAWGLAALFGLGVVFEMVPAQWWWTQLLLIADIAAIVALLSLAYAASQHPFAIVVRRFAIVALATLCLLTVAVAVIPTLAPAMQQLGAAGPTIWTVFIASLILFVPFVSRSQHVMREFAMLAGISTVATSVDLVFIAVFSFSQFTSLTLSLFLALGAYAAIRQWLVNQMMGDRALTTERMFEHLYRIAREVEAKPTRAPERLIELLQNVFEPLEAYRAEGREPRSRTAGNGATLLVPLPNLIKGHSRDGVVLLRFAERGKRLFTPEDARLADRILEQLMRALAHDRAVEQGRTEERMRIAQDLHDDIGARLLTLMYKAPNKEMEDYVRHTLQDLNTLSRGLASSNHLLSLSAAEWKTDISHRLEFARCELEWSAQFDEDPNLTVVQWSSLTRILRELVSNVIAHAGATHLAIDCALKEGHFRIVAVDNGKGGDPTRWSHGLGLGGIRKRVKLMGGTVRWTPHEPTGIECVVDIPNLK